MDAPVASIEQDNLAPAIAEIRIYRGRHPELREPQLTEYFTWLYERGWFKHCLTSPEGLRRAIVGSRPLG